jgi:hypothetical protein
MSVLKDERGRILQLVELGQITATQAAELMDALETEVKLPPQSGIRNRTLRLRATSLGPKQQKINLTASVPVSLLKMGLRLGGQLIPQLNNTTIADLLRAIDDGATGRLLDLQDLEKGERLEIFVE